MISLSLLISCLISFDGTGISILSSKNTAKNKIKTIKIVFIIKLLFTRPLSDLGLNLSCIITKLYLDSKIKTKL